MNIKKTATQDAYRWLEASRLQDEIANKFERLSGYGETFDKVFSKARVDAGPKHIKEMGKLRDRLDAASKPSHKGKIALVVGVAAAVYLTSFDKKVVKWAKDFYTDVEIRANDLRTLRETRNNDNV